MIEKIEVKNYQSHKHSLLELHPGVNVICGVSSSGKTALTSRAPEWVAFNRPLGLRMKSNFSDEKDPVFVGLTVNGKEISLRKAKDKTVYSVDGDEFSNPGTDVPDKVKEALNLSDLNFQDQLAPHFLISSSPGEVGRTMNEITRVEMVNGWVSGLTTRINAQNKEIAMLEAQKREKEETVKSLAFLDELDAEIRQIEALEKEASGYGQTIESLSTLVGNLVDIEAKTARLLPIISIKQEIEEIEALVLSMRKEEASIASLRSFIDVDDQCQALTSIIDDISPIINECLAQYEISKEAGDTISRINNVLFNLESNEVSLNDAKQKIEEARGSLRSAMLEMKRCPVCLSVIDENTVKHVLDCL